MRPVYYEHSRIGHYPKYVKSGGGHLSFANPDGWWPSRESKLPVEAEQEFIKNEWLASRILNKITPRKIKQEFIRVGSSGDGGYIMVKDLIQEGNIAYSFGVGDNCTWEKDMVSYGYEVHAWDGTIDPITEPGIEFHNQNVYKMPRILSERKHWDVDGLTVGLDIDGWEYEFIKNSNQISLRGIHQITIEFHFLLNMVHHYDNLKNLNLCFNKLLELFVPVHLHGNNCTGWFEVLGKRVPDTLEVTFVRKDLIDIVEGDVILPHELDEPCSVHIDEEIIQGVYGW